jgi:cytochrome c oxidase assembly protein subunit 15
MSLLSKLREGRGLSPYAAFVVAFMVLVILEGAVVRATGSGNGCGNHWPLCNGEVLPHHPRLATVIEFTHRSLTGVCTTLVALLIFWVFQSRPTGHPARRAAVWTGILLLTEGALGAVLVKGGYVERNSSNMRVFVQCVHFSNTMLLLAAMALTWWRVRNASPRLPVLSARPLACAAILATMITGATGSVAALADTLFPSPTLRAGLAQDFAQNAPLIVRTRWIHPAAAVLSVFCCLLLARRLRSSVSRTLVWLTALQLVLGVGDVLLLAPVTMQVLHLLGADLFWIALIIASEEALVREPRANAQQSLTREPLVSSS